MKKFSNKLTPAEAERLALLIEECAEVIHVGTKILRHGYASLHPNGGQNNRTLLEGELGDLQAAVALMLVAGDIDGETIVSETEDKFETVPKYLHHQSAALICRARRRARERATRSPYEPNGLKEYPGE